MSHEKITHYKHKQQYYIENSIFTVAIRSFFQEERKTTNYRDKASLDFDWLYVSEK